MSSFYNIFIKRQARKRLILKSFKNSVVFLRKGDYIIDPYLKYIYRKDLDTLSIIISKFGLLQNSSLDRNILLKYLFKPTIIKFPKKFNYNYYEYVSFNGNLLLFSNKSESEEGYGDFKVFDFTNKKILTKHISRRQYEKKMNNFKLFNSFFNIPSIEYSSEKDFITIEDMIDFVPITKLNFIHFSKLTEYIMSAYFKYFNKRTQELNLTKIKPIEFFATSNPYNIKGLGLIKNNIGQDLLYCNFPVVHQHGDLSLSNILLSTHKYFIIDWEHSAEFTFIYDIMWIWQNEAIHHNNYYFLEEYFQGKYDNYLTQIFNLFNLIYDFQQRFSYFNIVIAEMIYNRIVGKELRDAEYFINYKIIPMINNCNKLIN